MGYIPLQKILFTDEKIKERVENGTKVLFCSNHEKEAYKYGQEKKVHESNKGPILYALCKTKGARDGDMVGKDKGKITNSILKNIPVQKFSVKCNKRNINDTSCIYANVVKKSFQNNHI